MISVGDSRGGSLQLYIFNTSRAFAMIWLMADNQSFSDRVQREEEVKRRKTEEERKKVEREEKEKRKKEAEKLKAAKVEEEKQKALQMQEEEMEVSQTEVSTPCAELPKDAETCENKEKVTKPPADPPTNPTTAITPTVNDVGPKQDIHETKSEPKAMIKPATDNCNSATVAQPPVTKPVPNTAVSLTNSIMNVTVKSQAPPTPVKSQAPLTPMKTSAPLTPIKTPAPIKIQTPLTQKAVVSSVTPAPAKNIQVRCPTWNVPEEMLFLWLGGGGVLLVTDRCLLKLSDSVGESKA